ncbi:hypothetical protein VDGL01_04251 [Verticillium dahliae]
MTLLSSKHHPPALFPPSPCGPPCSAPISNQQSRMCLWEVPRVSSVGLDRASHDIAPTRQTQPAHTPVASRSVTVLPAWSSIAAISVPVRQELTFGLVFPRSAAWPSLDSSGKQQERCVNLETHTRELVALPTK